MSTMGENIRELRLKHKMTQEELGSYIGVKKSAIRKYESGMVENIPRSSIKKMADLFDVKPSYLMGWESQKKPTATGDGLSESEIAWLELYRMMPDEQTRAILVNMVEQFTALSEDAQALVLRLLQRDTTN